MGFVVIDKGKWPGGQIPYVYDKQEAEKDPTNKLRSETMIKTMNCWADWVNGKAGREVIKFVPKDKPVAGAHLVFQYAEKNNPKSYTIAACIGTLVSGDTVATGAMNLRLADDFYNYPHEVAHIIGLGHEHMRTPDGKLGVMTPKKDNFLAIAQQTNARKQCVNYGDYDYESITHYKGGSICANFDLPWSGTDNEPKIKDTRDSSEVQDGTWIQKHPPSDGDYASVLHLYG